MKPRLASSEISSSSAEREITDGVAAARCSPVRSNLEAPSLPGVVAGTLLTFIPAAGDFINRRLLGNPQNTVIGDVIDSRFHVIVDYPTAAALSFVLMIAIVILVFAYIKRAGTEELV